LYCKKGASDKKEKGAVELMGKNGVPVLK